MKILALDTETTGLNPARDQIIQLSAVLFDSGDLTTPVNDLPFFDTLIKHDKYHGSAFALQMNSKILLKLATEPHPSKREALALFSTFLAKNKCNKATLLGFNVAAFDRAFLEHTSNKKLAFHHRPLELGSMFAKQETGAANSKTLTQTLLKREVTHDALQDARDAVELYRIWAS